MFVRWIINKHTCMNTNYNTNVKTPPSAPPMVTPMTVTVVMLMRRLSTSFTLRPAAVFPAAGAEQQAARQQPSHRKDPSKKV